MTILRKIASTGQRSRPRLSLLSAVRAKIRPPGQLTRQDAETYLKLVKAVFMEDNAKYDEFFKVMRDFGAQRIDTARLLSRVEHLFTGHRALILGFNAFVPHGYEITLPANDEQLMKVQPIELHQAVYYVKKVETRFKSDELVFKTFLGILNMYREGKKSAQNMYEEVAYLFSEHADLLEDFTYFVPDLSRC